MNDTITISKKELETLIAEAISKNTLPRKKKDYRDAHITSLELEQINTKYSKISHRLSRSYAGQLTDFPSKDELRFGLGTPNDVYSRRRHPHGLDTYTHYKLFPQDINEMLRKISLAIMGASIIKDLDDDEFEYSLHLYQEFKEFFLEKYDERLKAEEKLLGGNE